MHIYKLYIDCGCVFSVHTCVHEDLDVWLQMRAHTYTDTYYIYDMFYLFIFYLLIYLYLVVFI